ncbi:MAG: heavy metal-binding domain-containing protein [Bacteroidia bacterium]|jgi:uncharacterized paraquat-inducible protein A
MKNSILVLFVVLGAVIVSPGCNNSSKEPKTGQTEEKIQYQCPMDCEKGKTYEEKGQCPVCGMDLEKAPVEA